MIWKVDHLIRSLWDFIENVNDDDPQRNEKFFRLRELVREYWTYSNKVKIEGD